MGFRRQVFPSYSPEPGEIPKMLSGIGFRLAAEPRWDTNIEDGLYLASVEGMDNDDLRVLSVLVTWLDVHAPRVNADRLVRLSSASSSVRVRAFWAAVGRWKAKVSRFVRLRRLHEHPRIPLLAVGSAFHLRQSGEDIRFVGGPLLVPDGVLRVRPSDVLSPEELARHHRAYRWRLLVGPTYRADMLALLEEDPLQTASKVARRSYGSFATAHAAKHDWATVQSAMATCPRSGRGLA